MYRQMCANQNSMEKGSKWASRVKALALSAPLHQESDLTNLDFAQFLKDVRLTLVLIPVVLPAALSLLFCLS